jgi:DNA helicase-2/ATP-dependent DNA helicase PcrA
MLSPADEATIKTKAREEWKRLREDSPNLLDLTGYELAELVVPTDSIRCMTIHVAKGLEFAAVALVSCEEEILPFSNYFRDPDVEAGRRQFFVALTRGQQLFVATFYSKQSRYLAEAGIQIGAGL